MDANRRAKGLVIGNSGSLSRGLRASGVFREELRFVGRSSEQALDVADRLAVRRLLRSAKPHFIINLSGVGRLQSASTANALWRVNVNGLKVLFEEILTNSPDTHLIHIGSAEVFGTGEKLVDEATAFSPETLYAKSKAEGSYELEKFGEKGGIYSELISFQLESGHSSPPYLMHSIATQLTRNLDSSTAHLTLDGPDFVRSFGDAQLLFDILPKIVEFPVHGKLLIGGTKRYTLRDLASEFINVMRAEFSTGPLELGEINLKRSGRTVYPQSQFQKAFVNYGLAKDSGLRDPVRNLLLKQLGSEIK